MSKSEPSDLSRINLTDNKDEIINKIKKAKTDPLPMPSKIEELENRPEAKNLIGIYSSINNLSTSESINKFSGRNFSEFKESLSQLLVDKILPISNEIKRLLDDKSYLDQILIEGQQKANKIASDKLKKIHEIVGF
jgi:tryptophanyl-tRNA synthetase